MRRQLRQQLYAANGGIYSIKSFYFLWNNSISMKTAAVERPLPLLCCFHAMAVTYCLIAPAPATFSNFSPSTSTSVGACLTP